ncbi:MAG: hypothetical protein QW511_03625 [Candidatus Methanomethylicia archaeon]
MSLTKISRKLRRKLKIGRVRLEGAEAVAKSVVSRWREERDRNISKWADEYTEGIRGANTEDMKYNLSEWYKILDTEVAPKLREVIPKVYAEVKAKYLGKKKVRVPAV